MQVRFLLDKPEKLEASLTIRMTVEEWMTLRDSLLETRAGGWIGNRLANGITEVISQAKKVFYSDGEKDADQLG